MKPFDLEAAERGDPIQAEDGRKLEFVAYVPEARPEYRVVVLCPTSGVVVAVREGVIFMAPERRTVWVNLLTWGGAYSYPSQKAADTACIQLDHERVGGRAWPLEIEE